MNIDYMSPADLAKPVGYSHVTITSPGRLVFVAGQVSDDASGQVVGVDDLAAQVEQVYANLHTALAAAGASMRDVVKVVTYVVGLTPEKAALVRAVRNRHLGIGPHPASTLVGVVSLSTPGLLIEIEVTAAID